MSIHFRGGLVVAVWFGAIAAMASVAYGLYSVLLPGSSLDANKALQDLTLENAVMVAALILIGYVLPTAVIASAVGFVVGMIGSFLRR